jgi:hypothetical protein
VDTINYGGSFASLKVAIDARGNLLVTYTESNNIYAAPTTRRRITASRAVIRG